jgi:hypothetical protein
MQLCRFLAIFLLTCVSALGMAKKQKVTVRFHVETYERDGSSVAMPVKLRYAQRDAFLSKMAEFSEININSIFLYRADNGTWGCVFQLYDPGRINLQTISDSARGHAMVVFIGTKAGRHQVIDMIIDRTVSDGVITVPRGITDGEALVLAKQFKIIGKDTKSKKAPPPPPPDGEPSGDWATDPNAARRTPPSTPPPRSPAPPPRNTTPPPPLPRAAD